MNIFEQNKAMIEPTFPENFTEPDHFGFNDFKIYTSLKKDAWEYKERNFSGNLPGQLNLEEHFPNDEIISKSGEVKNTNKAKDMANDDALYWEKEISDVMEKLKRFQSTLAEGKSTVIEDVFNLQPSEEYKKEKLTNEKDLKDSIAKVEKLDALLKINYIEEKKAKLSRLQMEEESRSILTALTNVNMTNTIRINSEEFLKLLQDTDQLESGLEKIEEEKEEEEKEKEKEKENKADDKKEKKKFDVVEKANLKTGTQPKLNFVEKNIELAKCGRGVLSLTEEEKRRIETLLIDIADPKLEAPEKEKMENPKKPEFYAFDDKSKSILSEIDQRLEAFSKEKTATASQSSLNLAENLNAETDKINTKQKKSPNRLIAVNKLLNRISGVTDEEINPLPPEDINRLIEEGAQSMGNESKPPPEVIADLVSNAKVLMPKFKYRFSEN